MCSSITLAHPSAEAVFTSAEERRDWHLGARKEGKEGGREDANDQSAFLLLKSLSLPPFL